MEIKIFDIVKYEKKKAMERFTKLQRIKKLVKVFEIVLGLILLYWSTMKVPLAVRFLSKLFEPSVSFLNSHFFFLIGNAIILAVFLLRKQNWAGNYSDKGDVYVEMRTRVAEDNAKLEKKESLLVPKVEKKSQIMEEHKRVQILSSPYPSPKVQEESQMVETHKQVQVLSSCSPSPEVQCEAVEVAIAEAEQEIRRFERTLSEKLKRELRRPETERRVVMPSIKSVEHLSNEDFKLAIDAFIHNHRVFSKERKTE